MAVKLPAAISRLWRVGVVSLVWLLWHVRNDIAFAEGRGDSFRILKMLKVYLIEAGGRLPDVYSPTCSALQILRNIGVSAKICAPPRWVPVSWWPPPLGWIKVNTDGSADGTSGEFCAGGVFRDSFSHVRGCFHVKGGRGEAFDAELVAAMSAIELAAARGWNHLWLETDSTYVEGLLSRRSVVVPWKWFDRWRRVLRMVDFMDFRVSHIFREGNAAADFMASPENSEGWWPFAIPALRPFVFQDVHTPFFFRAV